MSFYMITYGINEITEAYVGVDPEDVVERARPLINGWSEYSELETEELVDHLLADDLEFDIVQINERWKGYDLSLEVMRTLYENKSKPPHSFAEQV